MPLASLTHRPPDRDNTGNMVSMADPDGEPGGPPPITPSRRAREKMSAEESHGHDSDDVTCGNPNGPNGGPCGHKFCWVCLAPYDGPEGINQVGNDAHARECKYHTDNLPTL